MNAALRAVVRMCTYLGCRVFFVNEGYNGLVEGGKNIVSVHWTSVSSIMHKGGTIIGTSRSAKFREVSGRMEAAKNLINLGIHHLIVIGGDGSLSGANQFQTEWDMLCEELLKRGEITTEDAYKCEKIKIAGIVGSIDNDFYGTDLTLGSDSALHRIQWAVDAIDSTAYSHQRIFILEVMGRHCGYLALESALICEADYMFIPEMPPPKDWINQLVSKIQQVRAAGQRLNLIIVAEGAMDQEGNRITAEEIRSLIKKNIKADTRITVLGHVQRGGNPSAIDRILASRMGAEAALAVMEQDSCVITIDGNLIVRRNLMECVEETRAAGKALEEKQWKKAIRLRGRFFRRNYMMYQALSHVDPLSIPTDVSRSFKHTLAIVHIGVPACGLNAVVHSFVRTCLLNNICPLAIYGSNEGFSTGNFRKMKWWDVQRWVAEGGSALGCKLSLPNTRIPKMAIQLKKHNINGLLLAGGFQAYESALQLVDARKDYEEFRIPICVIPASISNNVPGTDHSVGCDTALNVITEVCDKLRLSALGTKRRVFVVETMGGHCGYLTTMAGLAAGADVTYIYEEKFTINNLIKDFYYINNKMTLQSDTQRGLILRSENCNEHYSTAFIHQLYTEEGKGLFSTRMNTIGHMQQGGSPTPFDRGLGIKMGTKAVEWFVGRLNDSTRDDGSVYADGCETACMLGVIRKHFYFTPIITLKKYSDFERKLPTYQWWMILRPLLRILSKHRDAYEKEAIYVAKGESDWELD